MLDGTMGVAGWSIGNVFQVHNIILHFNHTVVRLVQFLSDR